MRSSKNRSRSKGNRNRSVGGNIVNRVFDSSGPEGKVRGTPQQIIDKYNQLTRDAQLSNDRVAAENFQQHAEHYLRMLADAMREQEARRDQQGNNQQNSNQQRDRGDGGNADGNGEGQGHGQGSRSQQSDTAMTDEGDRSSDNGFNAVIDNSGSDDSGLVETPESAPKPKRPRTRRPRKPEGGDGAQTGGGDGSEGSGGSTPPQEAAE